MAQNQMLLFSKQIAENPDLRERLNQASSPESLLEIFEEQGFSFNMERLETANNPESFLEIANQEGLELTSEEFDGMLSESESENVELSQEDLKSVSGGFAVLAGWMAQKVVSHYVGQYTLYGMSHGRYGKKPFWQ